jgi:hypothetical protein
LDKKLEIFLVTHKKKMELDLDCKQYTDLAENLKRSHECNDCLWDCFSTKQRENMSRSEIESCYPIVELIKEFEEKACENAREDQEFAIYHIDNCDAILCVNFRKSNNWDQCSACQTYIGELQRKRDVTQCFLCNKVLCVQARGPEGSDGCSLMCEHCQQDICWDCEFHVDQCDDHDACPWDCAKKDKKGKKKS